MKKMKIEIWIAERKQRLDIWKIAKHKQWDDWNIRLWLHRLINKIHQRIREKLIDLLINIESWCHKKLDEIWDKLHDKNNIYLGYPGEMTHEEGAKYEREHPDEFDERLQGIESEDI